MNDNSKQSEMILKDNMWQVMLKLTLPAVFAMILHGLNVVFDGIFVGQFVGQMALGGVSVAYPLTQIALGFGAMIGGGAAAYLSIVIGEKNKDAQNKILGNANFLGVITTVVLMLVLLIIARPLMHFMGGRGEVLEIGLKYFRVTIIGTLFWVFSLTYNLIIRAEGKMAKAAAIMGSGLVVNIISNYILMGVFHFGVIGAAWGTNLGMLVYTLLSVFYFKSGKVSFEAKAFSFRKDKEIISKIISLGMPSLIMNIMNLIQGVVVLNAIGSVGTDYDLAFYGASLRLMTFMMTPLFALMRSLQPVVGINYGAKNYGRVIEATKTYILGGFIILMPIYLIVALNSQWVLGLMFKETVSQDNIFNFIIYISMIPVLTITMNGLSYFPSIGNGRVAGAIAMLRQVVLYIPAMIFLPRYFGVRAVYVGSFGIDVFLTVVLGILLLKSFEELRSKEEY